MGNEIRKSGLDIIGNIPWGTHFCQFYQTKQDLIDTLVPYFKTGLENNEFCIWITADNLTEQEVHKSMSKAVFGFSNYLKKGQIEILPYNKWYLKDGSFNSQRVLDGWVAKLHQSLTKGYDGLRLTGNTFWLEKDNWQSFTDYEETINSIIGKYKMIALCTYCLDKCNATEIVDVIRNHEFALIKQEGKWELFENSRYKNTKEALAESESLMHAFFDSPGVMRGIVEIVNDTTVQHIADNNVTASFMGLAPEALNNKLSSELGEPPEIIRIWVNHYKQSLKTGKPVQFEYQDQRGDNKVWLSATVNYLRTTASGQSQFAYIVSDITARKKMEEELIKERDFNSIILENTGALVVVLDREGRITRFNQACEATTGYASREVLGRVFWDILISPEELNGIQEIWQALINGDFPNKYENYWLGKNGSKRLIAWSNTALVDQNGMVEYVISSGLDVSEQKKAEQKLIEQAAMLANASDAIIGYDTEFRITYWNPGAEKIYGYSIEEALGKVGNVLLKPSYIGVTREALIERIFKDGHIEIESGRRSKDGRELSIETHIIAMRDGSGKIINYVAVDRDITDRKHSEELLRETSNYLNNLFTYANAPIIVWDPQFRITRFNPAFERLTGYNSDDILGKHLDVLFPPDKKTKSLQQIRRTLSGERWEVVEIPIIRVDGTVRIVLWNSANVYDNQRKEVIATIAQGQDITERKLAEENLSNTSAYLNNLFDYANAPIIVWDPQFRITRFNHAFERLTGINADEAIGKPLDILFPEGSKDESLEHIRSTVSGEHWDVVEIPILHRNGKVHIVLWNSATLFDLDGKRIVATIAQGQDITKRKQAEEEVNQLNEELRRHATELEVSNKELETFTYSVSHDLRAPLRTMEGFSQALLEDFSDILNDEGKDYLKRIQSSAELMAQLIDDMLSLSRLTRVDMQLETVNLSELAQLITSELKETQPKRKAKFVINSGLIVQGDGKLLRVLLENLLGNAWKFTGKMFETSIEVGAIERDCKKTYFVRDNGVGFDMTYADKLFQPFQRLHSQSEFPGTGIGLASVQRIIYRHGGRVWAESKVGGGATFYFTLD